MARTTYGKLFRTLRGRLGRYKYVNGRRVGFVSSTPRSKSYTRSYKRKYY